MMYFEHIAIWTDDIELMRQFYMKYFKTSSSEKYVNPKKKYMSYFLSFEDGKARIELMNIAEVLHEPICRQKMKGLAHFAVSVGEKETVDALTEKLREDGYTIASEPRTTGDGYYESAVLDPEGNYVEICA